MNIPRMTMAKGQAWNAYREYRVALGKSGDQRDKAVMAGYRALAKGKTVVNLVEVMKTAGTFESGLPRLAIIRADFSTCYCRRYNDGSVTFQNNQWSNYKRISLPSNTFSIRNDTVQGTAIVPLIPPKFRPAKTMLKHYFVLWEAEWQDLPKDPVLLKHLFGDLYAVVAEWNLTPLEQSVLR